MSTPTEARDDAVRRLLVDTVTQPARPRWRTTALIAAAAFVLGGGVAAGALSAAAAGRDASPSPSDTLYKDAFVGFLHGGHTDGPVAIFSGTGNAHLDLGTRPADATGLAYFLECGGSGRIISYSYGGESGLAGNSSPCRVGEAFGSSTDHDPTNSIVDITTDGTFTYTVWAQWLSVPAPPPPSAAQNAAVADGVVTDAEYRAAIDRFAACMTGAGYPLTDVTYTPELSYGSSRGAQDSGADTRCSAAEFDEVGALWSKQQQAK